MNISGAGLVKNSPNKKNAIKLLEFLVTPEAQEHIVNNTFEYPIIDGVEPSQLIAQFGLGFKQDLKTKVSTYYKNQAEALKIMTEAGWNGRPAAPRIIHDLATPAISTSQPCNLGSLWS